MSRNLEFKRQTPIWRWQDDRVLGYSAGYDPSPIHPEFTPGAEVQVTKPRTRYEYDGAPARDYNVRTGRSADYANDFSTARRGDGPDGQMSMFDAVHFHPFVHWMGTHPDFRGHIPTMLGVAALETKRRFGENLRSDTSLSAESQKIVERAAQAGAVQMPQFVSPNTISSKEEKFANYVVATKAAGGGRDVPKPEVSMGRQFVRDTLRAAKKPIQAPIRAAASAKQEKLFGP